MNPPLASRVLGTGRRLVLCHGFTQSGRCWGPFAADLADDHQVVLLDAPGHGSSGHDAVDLDEAGRLIGEVGRRAVYVGYSMGGRMALHLALLRPELVEGLVLIGATAGLDSEAERAMRRAADAALAERLEREGLESFLRDWLAGPLFAGLTPQAAALEARLQNRPEGLAASLRHVGTGHQRPLWSNLTELSMPVVALAGHQDRKFTQLAHRLAASIGDNASVEIVDGGHAVQLESPRATADAVRRLVRRVDAPEPPTTRTGDESVS